MRCLRRLNQVPQSNGKQSSVHGLVHPSAGRTVWGRLAIRSGGGLPRKSYIGPAGSRAAAYHFHPFAGGQPPMTILLGALKDGRWNCGCSWQKPDCNLCLLRCCYRNRSQSLCASDASVGNRPRLAAAMSSGQPHPLSLPQIGI